jgi:NitT/TauT family transport system permease protein
MFAGVVLLAVIGVSGAQIVRVLQRRVVFREQRSTRTMTDTPV